MRSAIIVNLLAELLMSFFVLLELLASQSTVNLASSCLSLLRLASLSFLRLSVVPSSGLISFRLWIAKIGASGVAASVTCSLATHNDMAIQTILRTLLQSVSVEAPLLD